MNHVGTLPTPVGSISISDPNLRTTRGLLYLYFFLLIAEGALRKWFLPMLSQPLILIRDPVAILIVLQYAYTTKYVFNRYTLPLFFVCALSLIFTMTAGHGNLVIAVFGFRTMVLHFFLVFIIGRVFCKDDVERLGVILLYLMIPVTLIMVAQYYTPQTSWINRGVGGDEAGSGFQGAGGYFRPSGLFSFVNGNTLLLGLTTAFIAYFFTERSRCPNWLLFVAAICALITLPVSLSRTHIFQVAIMIPFIILASIRSGKAAGKLVPAFLLVPLLFILLLQFEFVQTAVEVMDKRFSNASRKEGSISDSLGSRVFGLLFGAVTGSHFSDLPITGRGLGLGTNIGAVLASGERGFLVAEGEWPRVIGEMGWPLGIVVLIIRVILAIQLSILALRSLVTQNALPFILLGFGLPVIVIAEWAQPTSLGFWAVTTGLILASFRPTPAGRLVV